MLENRLTLHEVNETCPLFSLRQNGGVPVIVKEMDNRCGYMAHWCVWRKWEASFSVLRSSSSWQDMPSLNAKKEQIRQTYKPDSCWNTSSVIILDFKSNHKGKKLFFLKPDCEIMWKQIYHTWKRKPKQMTNLH